MTWSRIKVRARRVLRDHLPYWYAYLPEARVDPAIFPEDEFPVACLHCDYELRGAPVGRCPECGTEFDRGRLLVQRYLAGKIGGTHRRFAKAANCCFLVALAVSLSVWIGWRFVARNPGAVLAWLTSTDLLYVVVLCTGIPALLLLVSAGLYLPALLLQRRNREKARRIVAAMQQS